jgi:hypothetical protein
MEAGGPWGAFAVVTIARRDMSIEHAAPGINHQVYYIQDTSPPDETSPSLSCMPIRAIYRSSES